jgi:AraC-like DNA-binding protein
VLSTNTIVSRDGVQIADVACRHRRGRGQTAEQVPGHTVVFIRRGCFVRSAEGVRTLLDPTLAYCMNPGEEQRYDHPQDHGDDCTSLSLQPGLVASLWGGAQALPSQPLPISPRIDLEHRLLLSAARRGEDPHELIERAIALIARALEQADPRRLGAGRPATVRARRALANDARELLASNTDLSLPELADALAVSPHHLSRVFRSQIGHTVSRHRMRLRARGALERLAGGDRDLARLAAELGFADQSHLCRVISAETGSTPSALAQILAAQRLRAPHESSSTLTRGVLRPLPPVRVDAGTDNR